jgi:hypothetical protein
MIGPGHGQLSLALNLDDLIERCKGHKIEVENEWYNQFNQMLKN